MKDDEDAPWYGAQGRGKPRTDRRSGAARVRSVRCVQRADTWRGADLKTFWGAGRPGEGAWPRMARGPREALRVRAHGARDVAFRCQNRFNLGHFEHDFLPIFN
jgi:hypothetical protein